MEISKHAKYEVWYRGGSIAWFVTEDDARDFIGSQPHHELYEVKHAAHDE